MHLEDLEAKEEVGVSLKMHFFPNRLALLQVFPRSAMSLPLWSPALPYSSVPPSLPQLSNVDQCRPYQLK